MFANVIPGTEYATDATAWLVLTTTVVGLLAIGRRIITGPLATEQKQMKQQLTDLAKAVSHLAESVAVGTIGNTAIRQFFWLKP